MKNKLYIIFLLMVAIISIGCGRSSGLLIEPKPKQYIRFNYNLSKIIIVEILSVNDEDTTINIKANLIDTPSGAMYTKQADTKSLTLKVGDTKIEKFEDLGGYDIFLKFEYLRDKSGRPVIKVEKTNGKNRISNNND